MKGFLQFVIIFLLMIGVKSFETHKSFEAFPERGERDEQLYTMIDGNG